MRKVPNTIAPFIPLDRASNLPLHRQIYDALRGAILSGRLRAGQQVPATRTLASEIGVSRVPVVSAYEQLQAEGYLETLQGSGTYVSRLLQQDVPAFDIPSSLEPLIPGPRRISSRSTGSRYQSLPWATRSGAFTVGQVAEHHFPIRLWSDLITRHVRNSGTQMLQFGDPMGLLHFRASVSDYLRSFRGVNCSPEQIMVVNGSQQALEICARVLTEACDAVWLEEPGYALARHVFKLAGCRIVSVPTDENGLDIDAGRELCRSAKLAYVTPSHQFPLGSVMSASRRLQLLEWAQSSGSWIIEDDYDSEYRFEGAPLSSLQGIDRDSRVLYIGTFSKTVFPALRVGYIVIPPDLNDHFRSIRMALDVFPATLNQAVLAEFIREGHFARHLRRMRVLYRERRDELRTCLCREFGEKVRVMGDESGMHLAAVFPGILNDEEIACNAADRGLWLWPLSRSYAGRVHHRGFVLGFGNTETRAIAPAVDLLAKIVAEAMSKSDSLPQPIGRS